MSKQIRKTKNKSDNVNNISTETDSSPGSWSELANRYIRLVKIRQRKNNFIKNVSGAILVPLIPAILYLSFAYVPIVGQNMYSFGFAIILGLIALHITDYAKNSFVNMHFLPVIMLFCLLSAFSPLLFKILTIPIIVTYIISS